MTSQRLLLVREDDPIIVRLLMQTEEIPSSALLSSMRAEEIRLIVPLPKSRPGFERGPQTAVG